MANRTYYVYILASSKNGVLYTGVTNNLIRRVYEHRNGIGGIFTSKYHVKRLVYFECIEHVESAILREKQLKSWNRSWKIELIEKNNAHWIDLYETLINEDPRSSLG